MPKTDKVLRARGTDVAACGDKPSYVRQLNFGRSILELNVAKAPRCAKNGDLVLDRNVAGIPCTERADFVRKWVEAHEVSNRCSSDDDESCFTSPVLGSTFAELPDKSPVLGNRRKRAKGKASLNGTVEERVAPKAMPVMKAVTVQQNSTCLSASSCVNRRVEGLMEENNNRKRKMCSIEYSRGPSFKAGSPILARNSCLYNWSGNMSKETKENLCNMPCPLVSREMSFIKASQMFAGDSFLFKKRRKIVCRKLQWKDREKSWNGMENRFVESNINLPVTNSTKISSPLQPINKLDFEKEICTLKHSFEGCTFSANPESDSTGSRKDFKENPNIEVDNATENDDDNDKDVTIVNSESNTSLSRIIEDVDSQDVLLCTKNLKDQEHAAFMAGRSSGVQSSCFSKTSEETFYAPAEQAQCSFPNTALPEKISQVLSKSTPTENKVSQTDVFISSETSPSKTNSDPAMCLNILDSVKKKKKSKKGSLVERMQALINRELSFVRIWRHQIRQTGNSETTTPPVIVLVHKCTSCYGRQFLEGIVWEDNYNQIYKTVMEESEQSVCQPSSDTFCQKSITLMTIPDITGKIEMKSECTVQIYPPWEVVDKKKLILNVTYINILPNKEIRSIQWREALSKTKKQVVQDFSCPCIAANKVVPPCRGRVDGKPNVTEIIFKF